MIFWFCKIYVNVCLFRLTVNFIMTENDLFARLICWFLTCRLWVMANTKFGFWIHVHLCHFTVLVTGMSWTLTGPLSSSESIKPPTLFPLVQCSSASQIAVGCLALDFFPESLTYQWSNQDSQESEQYPVIAKDGRFSRVSLIHVSKTDWDAGKSYNCSVSHNGQSKHVTLKSLGGMYMCIMLLR